MVGSAHGNSGTNEFAIQPDGKIVVAGGADLGRQQVFALARYTGRR